jgi:TolB-like protein
MKPRNAGEANDGGEAAARQFVRTDSSGDALADAALASWIAAHPDNERALQRVELAVELGRRLAADPASPLYAEAARAVRHSPRRLRSAVLAAWGGALAAALLVAVFILRERVAEPAAPAPLEAARLVAFDAPNSAVAVLPSGVVVDASTVAVLPFSGSGDAALAAGLEQDVVTALRTVPGLYVIGDAAVRPYADTELAAAELGGLLGARGLVDASIELSDGRVRVSARLRESATGVTLWQTQFDRPVDELRAVRTEIAEHVATTMFDSSLRAQVVYADRSSAPGSAGKPIQQ